MHFPAARCTLFAANYFFGNVFPRHNATKHTHFLLNLSGGTPLYILSCLLWRHKLCIPFLLRWFATLFHTFYSSRRRLQDTHSQSASALLCALVSGETWLCTLLEGKNSDKMYRSVFTFLKHVFSHRFRNLCDLFSARAIILLFPALELTPK